MMNFRHIKKRIEIAHFLVLVLGFFLILILNPNNIAYRALELDSGKFESTDNKEEKKTFFSAKSAAILPQKSKKSKDKRLAI